MKCRLKGLCKIALLVLQMLRLVKQYPFFLTDYVNDY